MLTLCLGSQIVEDKYLTSLVLMLMKQIELKMVFGIEGP